VAGRTDLSPAKRHFAHEHPGTPDLLAAIEAIKPTMLIGVSGNASAFDEPVVRTMARLNPWPVIFALSNPTSRAECTAAQAYAWSDGRAVFASGSPFPDFEYKGTMLRPGQCNNAYVFPGIGLGIIVSQARRVTDEMFFAAATTLASLVTEQDLAAGRVYPDLQRIRKVSASIACAVARVAFQRGLTTMLSPEDLSAHVHARMYNPAYPDYV
jgi:malate dehydrogenase (oxaloacetate-decarboxylating)(NADP+)